MWHNTVPHGVSPCKHGVLAMRYLTSSLRGIPKLNVGIILVFEVINPVFYIFSDSLILHYALLFFILLRNLSLCI